MREVGSRFGMWLLGVCLLGVAAATVFLTGMPQAEAEGRMSEEERLAWQLVLRWEPLDDAARGEVRMFFRHPTSPMLRAFAAAAVLSHRDHTLREELVGWTESARGTAFADFARVSVPLLDGARAGVPYLLAATPEQLRWMVTLGWPRRAAVWGTQESLFRDVLVTDQWRAGRTLSITDRAIAEQRLRSFDPHDDERQHREMRRWYRWYHGQQEGSGVIPWFRLLLLALAVATAIALAARRMSPPRTVQVTMWIAALLFVGLVGYVSLGDRLGIVRPPSTQTVIAG